jgi:hypothetical protein
MVVLLFVDILAIFNGNCIILRNFLCIFKILQTCVTTGTLSVYPLF